MEVGVITGMSVPRVEEDGLQFRARLILRLQKPHPHEVSVVVDDQQAIPQAVGGGYTDRTPQITRHVLKRGGWLLRSCAIFWRRRGFVQIARLTRDIFYRTRHNRYRHRVMRMLSLEALHV